MANQANLKCQVAISNIYSFFKIFFFLYTILRRVYSLCLLVLDNIMLQLQIIILYRPRNDNINFTIIYYQEYTLDTTNVC